MNGNLKSRKFWLVAGIVLLCGLAVGFGKAQFGEATAIVMPFVGAYLGLNVAMKKLNGGNGQ